MENAQIHNPNFSAGNVSAQQRTPVPNSVFYSKIKPMGYATKTSAYRFQPTGFVANNIGNSDIVRFIISLSTGYWDPYSAYCNLIIDCSTNPNLVPNPNTEAAAATSNYLICQVDNSAQSFFSSLIIYKDGKELERIMELDTIAAIQYDLNSSPTTKFQREQEGCGGMVTGNYDTFQTAAFPTKYTTSSNTPAAGTQIATTVQMNYYNPRALTNGLNISNSYVNGAAVTSFLDNQYIPALSATAAMSLADYSLSNQNPYAPTGANLAGFNQSTLFTSPLTTAQTSITTVNYDQDLTAGSINSIGYPVGTNVYPVTPIYTNYQVAQAQPPFLGIPPANEIPTLSNYQNIYVPTVTGGIPYVDGIFSFQSGALPTNLPILGNGFSFPFAQNFCGTCMEARFCAIPMIRAIVNGASTIIANLTNQFSFPLMSGLLGSLIPEQNYKLLPMSALRELILEFKMSPYALFTSNNACSRAYRVTKFEIVAEIIELDPITTMAVEMQIDGEGFYFQSVSWFLGPTYNINANNVPGQIQVNLGFDSLKTIVLCFLAGDYTTANAARKQYRLSQNLTSLQLQIGSKYYPQQPITGNSGTNCGYISSASSIAGNNSEFYINTLRAFNLLHRLDSPHIYGIGNTAVNFRYWNPTAAIFNLPGTGNTQTTSAIGTIQTWTSDINYYFENSCVGKCIYGFDLEAFNYEDVIGGVNTNLERSPFTINLTYYNQTGMTNGQWTRNSTAYVFCLYDLVVRINRFGVETLGRA